MTADGPPLELLDEIAAEGDIDQLLTEIADDGDIDQLLDEAGSRPGVRDVDGGLDE